MSDEGKSHTDMKHLSGFFLFKDRCQQFEDILPSGYSYRAKFYKKGDHIGTWREREMFILKPQTAGSKYSTLVYFEPQSQGEKGRVNLGEAIIELNENAAHDFTKNSSKSVGIEGFENAVGFDISGSVPRDISKRITIVMSHEESKNFLVALYLAAAKTNVREFLRANGKLYPDNRELMNLLVMPFEPRLANQFDLSLRTALGCIKFGLSIPKCYGIASHMSCCCFEFYLQSGLIYERRDIIDPKSISVPLSNGELQNMKVNICNYFCCLCHDRSGYHSVYEEFEKQEIEDSESHFLEEMLCFIFSRRRGSCLCDLFEIPVCQCRSIPCMSTFCKAQHTILCFDNRCAFPTTDTDVPFELGCCGVFCYNALSRDRLADDIASRDTKSMKSMKREKIHEEKAELITFR